MDVIEDRVAGAPLAALRALRQANQHLDLSIYLVGGSVRDLLLERPIKDLDFAVEGDAPSLAGRLAQELGGRVVLHARFGTASVYFGDERVDLATARREHYDRPAALPRVTPAPIDEDLARRDFSINAMALPLAAHRTSLVDPFHGQEDLELGLVRVLHPQSFVDDPTRILRAVRYEQRLGLIIEKETLGHLDRAVAAGGIAALSGDRIRNELDRIFQESRPELALERALDLGVLAAVHPALATEDTRRGFWALAQQRDSSGASIGGLAWLSVMGYRMDRAHGDAVTQRLNLPATWRKAIKDSIYLGEISCQLEAPELPNSGLVRLLAECVEDALAAAVAVTDSDTVRRRLTEYLGCLKFLEADLDGSDMQSLGIPEGPELGKMLDQLKNAKLDGAVTSKEEQRQMVRDLLNAGAYAPDSCREVGHD
jgi:tRNA nucleotidyltransferase (CCA-adding enzyme)